MYACVQRLKKKDRKKNSKNILVLSRIGYFDQIRSMRTPWFIISCIDDLSSLILKVTRKQEEPNSKRKKKKKIMQYSMSVTCCLISGTLNTFRFTSLLLVMRYKVNFFYNTNLTKLQWKEIKERKETLTFSELLDQWH